MTDLASLPPAKLRSLIEKREKNHSVVLDETIQSGMGNIRHSEMVELAKSNDLAHKYLNTWHDLKTARDELKRRQDYHGGDKIIRKPKWL